MTSYLLEIPPKIYKDLYTNNSIRLILEYQISGNVTTVVKCTESGASNHYEHAFFFINYGHYSYSWRSNPMLSSSVPFLLGVYHFTSSKVLTWIMSRFWGSDSSVIEDSHLPGCNAASLVKWFLTFTGTLNPWRQR